MTVYLVLQTFTS